ncbi:MAG: NAD-dependent epimerase/dehydratase family protein [Candidatus Aenigmarchaeota archaeon]|nr:NAD-dependent epimerase/dehydratase family protein [Candidatus Aenigmarchaeota archaeon]
MDILVTGGCGFIGSNLVKELQNEHKVVVFDNLSTGKRENIPESMNFIKGDLRNEEDLNKILDVDAVFHRIF